MDVAFHSWHLHKEPKFTGVQAGMVGRKQRRFIVWHSVPKGVDTADAVRNWLVSVLPETTRLVREHLPGKSKPYPAEQLVAEIEGLREMLQERNTSTVRRRDLQATWAISSSSTGASPGRNGSRGRKSTLGSLCPAGARPGC